MLVKTTINIYNSNIIQVLTINECKSLIIVYIRFLPILQKMNFLMIINIIPVPVAQWLEHCVSSAKVVGSIPREHMY